MDKRLNRTILYTGNKPQITPVVSEAPEPPKVIEAKKEVKVKEPIKEVAPPDSKPILEFLRSRPDIKSKTICEYSKIDKGSWSRIMNNPNAKIPKKYIPLIQELITKNYGYESR